MVVVCDTAIFGINQMPSKHRTSIADTNTDNSTYDGSLSRREWCVMIYEINRHQFANSEHIWMTTKSLSRIIS